MNPLPLPSPSALPAVPVPQQASPMLPQYVVRPRIEDTTEHDGHRQSKAFYAPSAAVDGVTDVISDVRRVHRRMDASYAGAWALTVLIEYPCIQSFKLTFTAAAEYDDEGGTYRSASGSIYAIKVIEATAVPEDWIGDDGQVDLDYAADCLTQEVVDDAAGDLYECFADDSEYIDITLVVDRNEVAHLLAQVQDAPAGYVLSGRDAFLALFPEFEPAVEFHDDELRAIRILEAGCEVMSGQYMALQPLEDVLQTAGYRIETPDGVESKGYYWTLSRSGWSGVDVGDGEYPTRAGAVLSALEHMAGHAVESDVLHQM